MEKVAVYGKGGIGKSTLSANLSVAWAQRGVRMLHVGCDPKHDSTRPLLSRQAPLPTVMGLLAENPRSSPKAADFLSHGHHGVDCVEAGGPEPGIGCAGRGITRMFELFEDQGLLDEERYDLALFDVLGDVVCGGFAAPLRAGYARKLLIVTSEEAMSLYAANNIAKAVVRHAENGVRLIGLVANLRDGAEDSAVRGLATKLNSRVLATFVRDVRFREAERQHRTVMDIAPESDVARQFRTLAEDILSIDPESLPVPTPLSDESFETFITDDPSTHSHKPEGRAP